MNGLEFLSEYEKLTKDETPAVVIIVTTSINPDDEEKAKSFSCVKGFENKYLTGNALKKIMDTYF
ncbi:MAG TPA: hypothetical protein VFF27_04690 [Bacteroidia bacterium]|jgi:hypothetical protein|nr:hypothetical protein [Bacteroidia bacterium]